MPDMPAHHDAAYVRTEILPEQPPPVSEMGGVRWLRENLFSGWFNSIMTLLSLAFIYWVLSLALPWIFQSSWTAGSLNECRQQIDAAFGPAADGACWSVIRERWHQLLFGFYPSEGYWRVILALVTVLAALAPVLFAGLPKRMLWLSVAAPFIAPWLLWGGTVWAPVAIAAGFAVAVVTFRLVAARAIDLVALIAAVLAMLVWWYWLSGPVANGLNAIIPIGLAPVDSRNFGGFMLSVTIGVTGITASLPIGVLLALGRQSRLFIVKTLSVGFIEFIRGVPLITLLFVASVLLNYFLPPGTNFDIILRVMIMVTIFAAAYVAEAVRGGLAALPTGQYEAADALGLDYWKAQRLIIMPQALKVAIPSIVSIFIGLFKDTTLVSIIGLMDPIGLSNAIRANAEWNGIVWEIYGFIALMFWIVCFSMSRYSMYLERKLETGNR